MINKEEFMDWKSNPVTKAFFSAAEERISDAKDSLAGSAGLDPDMDNFLRGFIHAYREIQQFRIEESDEN